MIKQTERKVGAIASTSLKPVKYARLLHRMVRYYQPSVIVELGTSFGISTSYMAKGNPSAGCIRWKERPRLHPSLHNNSGIRTPGMYNWPKESSPLYYRESCMKFRRLILLSSTGTTSTGRHSTTFQKLRARSHQRTIMVFDDIHWSRGYGGCLEQDRDDPAVTLSIDLFIGIVFFDKSFLVKQHFPIRF